MKYLMIPLLPSSEHYLKYIQHSYYVQTYILLILLIINVAKK